MMIQAVQIYGSIFNLGKLHMQAVVKKCPRTQLRMRPANNQQIAEPDPCTPGTRMS